MEPLVIMKRRITDLFGELAKTEDNAGRCRLRHRLAAAYEDLKNCEKSEQADTISSAAQHGEDRKVSFLGDQDTIFAARAEISTEGPLRAPQLIYAAEVARKPQDVRDHTSKSSEKPIETMEDGVVVYVDSCAQDNFCNALKSKVFKGHRKPSRLETNTVIDGGNHHHKVESIASMYTYVAGEKIKIDNIPLVPTFKPNVLSHGFQAQRERGGYSFGC